MHCHVSHSAHSVQTDTCHLDLLRSEIPKLELVEELLGKVKII